jgi:hypothetical protein
MLGVPWLCFAVLLCGLSSSAQLLPSVQPAADPVLRGPFTLKLRVDKDHYYEERFEKQIPFVADNDIYLFSGEKFGVNLTVANDQVVGVSYQANVDKADVCFTFSQEVEKSGGAMMMLTIQNKTKQALRMDALMTVPGKQGIYKTSILPIQGGLSDFESWPHPIVQLVLRNLRFDAAQSRKN